MHYKLVIKDEMELESKQKM